MDALMHLSGSEIAQLQGTEKSLLDKYYESLGFTVELPGQSAMAASTQPAATGAGH
jgi:hypothetical protein